MSVQDKLYDIIESKLGSMHPCSNSRWNEALEAAGIFWAGDEKRCPTHQFVMVWDPFIRMVGDRKLKRTLIVPVELAMKILALGHMP